jgi:hypothetical protein
MKTIVTLRYSLGKKIKYFINLLILYGETFINKYNNYFSIICDLIIFR